MRRSAHHHSGYQISITLVTEDDQAKWKDQTTEDIYWLLKVSLQGSEMWRGETCLSEMQERSSAMHGLQHCTIMARLRGAQGAAANVTPDRI